VTRIHVRRDIIAADGKAGTVHKAIAVESTGRRKRYGFAVTVHGASRVVYRPGSPLSCGAEVLDRNHVPRHRPPTKEAMTKTATLKLGPKMRTIAMNAPDRRRCVFCDDRPLPKDLSVPAKAFTQARHARLVPICADCALAAGVRPRDIARALTAGQPGFLGGAQGADVLSPGVWATIDTHLDVTANADELLDDLRFALEDRCEQLRDKVESEGVHGVVQRAMRRRLDHMERLFEKLSDL
jgi:hypothetical protein